MEADIQEKIAQLCSYVCNGKTYQYEQKLYKAAEHELYDAAIIYAWNLFMLFVYEKIWQIRELEKLDDARKFYTDKKAFLSKVSPHKPDKFEDDFLDGHLCHLNKLHEENKGEDFVIGRLKDVYPTVDQQYFKKAQKILKSRHDGAHVNEVQQDIDDLKNVLRELIQVVEQIYEAHKKHLHEIFNNLEKDKIWYLSEQDIQYLDKLFSDPGVYKIKYIYIAKLISDQDVSSSSLQNIKENSLNFFLASSSWKDAKENAYLLVKPLINYLNQNDILRILKEVFNKRGNVYNQILQADGIDDFFLLLYQFSSNTFQELQNNWKDFIKRLKDEGYADNFAEFINYVAQELED